jgi:hypothetical protein
MKRFIICAALLAAALSAKAAPAPDVDALITYETRQVTAAGVTRTERWQERLVRRGDTVWTERVLPERAAALHTNERANEHAAEHAGHKHFDFDSAARLVQREPNGQLRLRFVDREHRIVVSVPAAEFGAVGFDGSWEAAAFVVPPAVIARMGAARDGWRREQAQGWSHRVRWSEAQQLPRQLESQRDDGSIRRIVSITPSAPSKSLPWMGLTDYTQKEYDDFMD